MTIGVGGKTQEQALSELSNMTSEVCPIEIEEYKDRIKRAQLLMQLQGLDALYLNAGTNLYYFTGMRWFASERLVGAIITAKGEVEYIAPHFEIETLLGFMKIKGNINGWQEDESPYALVTQTLQRLGISKGKIGIDESSQFFISDGLTQAAPELKYVSAKAITAGCRMQKSNNEIALMQIANDMTIAVHKATASILKPGISTKQVTEFINLAHKKVGAKGSSFCIVLFGIDSSFPHGVKTPKNLQDGEVVLIDTGCLVEGYNSDITRTYVYGEATARHREIWAIEKAAQAAAFERAKVGLACGEVDIAAREYIASKGLGPDYQVPGLPHRTGHGCGLDIHEWPYLVRNDNTPLAEGMCFSNEPMLVIPEEFGIRLEDHFYMTGNGPKWFSQPSFSIDDPFGIEA